MNVKKNSVFVYGYYGLNNFGDDLLVYSVIKKLKEREFGSVFYVRNHGEIVSLENDESVVLTNLERKLVGNSGLFQKIAALTRYLAGHQIIFKKCHSFVLGGGTLVSAQASYKSILVLFLLVILAKLNKLKIYGVGLGVGNINNPIVRWMAGNILLQCEFAGIRDASSLNAAKLMAPYANTKLTSDLVFGLLPMHSVTNSKRERFVIGISLVEPYLNADGNLEVRSLVLDALVGAIRAWATQGHVVRFFSFQEATLSNNTQIGDGVIFGELMHTVGLPNMSVEIISPNAASIRHAYGDLDLLVGMRFHGMVVAALNSVPFVGFSYDLKMADLCTAYGMPYCAIANLSTDWLLSSSRLAANLHVDHNVTSQFSLFAEDNYLPFSKTNSFSLSKAAVNG